MRAVRWILTGLLAIVFLFEGVDKFSGSRLWLRVFDAIGFGQWFRYVTGAVEIAGAIMLLVPRTAFIGAALLICTMIGALLVHVFVMGVGPQTGAVVVLLLLLIFVARQAVQRSRDSDPV